MTMLDDRPGRPDSGFNDGPSPDHGRRLLGWLPLLVLAFLVFELTADPSLGVLVGCLKFGLEDTRTALWLRRVDPDRRRGRACSWFYLTHGVFRVGLIALATIFLIVFLETAWRRHLRAGNDLAMRQGMTAVLTVFGCYTLGSITALIALITARRCRVPIWIGRQAHRARRANSWPPFTPTDSQRPNAASVVLLWAATALILFPMVAAIAVMVATSEGLANPAAGGPIKGALVAAIVLGELAFFALIVVSGLALAWKLGGRVVAFSPLHCYPDPFESPRSVDGWEVDPALDGLR